MPAGAGGLAPVLAGVAGAAAANGARQFVAEDEGKIGPRTLRRGGPALARSDAGPAGTVLLGHCSGVLDVVPCGNRRCLEGARYESRECVDVVFGLDAVGLDYGRR